MKRRIIRSFFIVLLLLCVGGWLWSYKGLAYVGYEPSHSRTSISMESFGGKIHLDWFDRRGHGDGWSFGVEQGDEWVEDRTAVFDQEFGDKTLLGFLVRICPDIEGGPTEEVGRYNQVGVAIPYWFPTALSAILLWWVWRKTQPPVKGRAFPVQFAKPISEQAGTAG